MTKRGKNQVSKYLQDTDPRTEWERAGVKAAVTGERKLTGEK